MIDDDNSGFLDANEIANMMKEVALGMGVDAPTTDDVTSILASLDDDSDGKVDKEEFAELIMLVLGNVLEDEEINKQRSNSNNNSRMR